MASQGRFKASGLKAFALSTFLLTVDFCVGEVALTMGAYSPVRPIRYDVAMGSARTFVDRFADKFPLGQEILFEVPDDAEHFGVPGMDPDFVRFQSAAAAVQRGRRPIALTIFLGQAWTMRYRDPSGNIHRHDHLSATSRQVQGLDYEVLWLRQVWKERTTVYVQTKGVPDAARCQAVMADLKRATGGKVDLEIQLQADPWFVLGNFAWPFSTVPVPPVESLKRSRSVKCNAERAF